MLIKIYLKAQEICSFKIFGFENFGINERATNLALHQPSCAGAGSSTYHTTAS